MELICFIQNNVLFLDGQAKLNDFGISRVLDDAEGLSSRVHGNCRFQAPEILIAKETSHTCVGNKYLKLVSSGRLEGCWGVTHPEDLTDPETEEGKEFRTHFVETVVTSCFKDSEE